MFRVDLQKLSSERLKEARTLLKAGHYDGASYLGGFAVECALKAVLAKTMQRHQFPDKKFATDVTIHDLVKLLSLAGLRSNMDRESPALKAKWALVASWGVEQRYRLGVTKIEATDFMTAVSGRDAVLPWIRKHW